MLYKTVPKQDVTKQFTLPSIYGIYAITILLDYMQYFFTSHIIEKNCGLSVSSTTIQYSPVIFDLLYEVCNIQHHTNRLMQMQQFTGSFQKINANLLMKIGFYFWMQLMSW